jgi:cytochrome c556
MKYKILILLILSLLITSKVNAQEDSQIMVRIAKCESGLRQFDSNGDVLRGKVNPQDVGMFQINEKYHLEKAKELGYDIYTTEGNIKMAAYIYLTEGAKAWSASSKCWNSGKDM